MQLCKCSEKETKPNKKWDILIYILLLFISSLSVFTHSYFITLIIIISLFYIVRRYEKNENNENIINI